MTRWNPFTVSIAIVAAALLVAATATDATEQQKQSCGLSLRDMPMK
jgi:hypothetical protein